MFTIKEISCGLILFVITYLILYLDLKIKTKCDECQNQSVSFKIPIFMGLVGLVTYRYIEPSLSSLYSNYKPVIKQDIITDMADF